MLSVSEVFYSIQGEGKTIGQPAVFVRLSGCNLMCGGQGTQKDGELHDGATWRCDSIEVWMKGTNTQYEDVLPEDCYRAVQQGANVIITGGEPLIQQMRIVVFIEYLKTINKDVSIEIETNGTKMPDPELIRRNPDILFNCSPKLANSGMPKNRRLKPEVLQEINKHNSIFKFVVSDFDDVMEIMDDYVSLDLDQKKFYIMPSGENQELLEQSRPACAEICKIYGWNLTTRLHIDIWNQKTGV